MVEVGYNIIEHQPPKNIGQISATKIREKIVFKKLSRAHSSIG